MAAGRVMLRRSPLKRGTPLRTLTQMVRRRARNAPGAAVKAYWSQLPDRCVCCGRPGTIVHHILANAPGKHGRRDHWLVVRLTPWCHNMGDASVHLLGSEAKFQAVHGVDLVAVAVANRDAWRLQHV
jgi:hypothetical protein